MPTSLSTLPPTGTIVHTVRPGDSLSRIARYYDTTVEAIAASNGIVNPNLISRGQPLVIPVSDTSRPRLTTGGTTYVVQPNDTLHRIAARYNTSYLYLALVNGFSDPAHLYAGQVLNIP
jgi:putative chitinase